MSQASELTERTFAAVIFDNDGTLVDSTGSVERSWLRWAMEHDIDPDRLAGHHGMPASAIIASVAPDLDPEAAQARIDELELGDTDGVVALPGAAEAIATLAGEADRQAGRRPLCTIATSATTDLARVRLDAAGIDVPEHLVTIDDVERGKPHPDPYLLAAQRLGADPGDCLVVEDAPSGVAAARAAGCAVLAVTTTTAAEDLSDADLVVDSLADVAFAISDGRVRITRR